MTWIDNCKKKKKEKKERGSCITIFLSCATTKSQREEDGIVVSTK